MRHGNLFAYSRVERNSPSLRLTDPLDKRCEQAEESQKPTHNSTLFRQLNRIVLIAFLIFAYLAVLEYAYRDIVAPRFGYLGYIYRLPDKQWIALGIAQLTVLSLFMPRKISRGSDTIVWIIYVVVVVPISLVPYFGSQLAPIKVFGFSTFAAINLLFIARFSSTRILRKFVPIASKSSVAFWSILLIFTIATYGYSFAIFGFRFEIMSMFEVASTRLEYRDEVAPTVPLLGYLVSNQGNVINPLLICIGAAHRRWYLAAFGTLGQLLLYSVTGYKTALLSIIVCILVSVILSKRKSIWGGVVLVGTVFLAWSTVILDRFFSFGAVDIVVNRMLITAGHLTPYYLKVYEEHNWHYWSYSFLSGIVEPTHEMTPGFYVSVMSFNRPDIQSNANMFADGYANLGYLGIIIEAVFLAMVLLLINSSSRGLPIQIVMPTLILPAFALCNGSPFTGFLSFGLGLSIIMFALIPRKKPMESNRGRRRHLSFLQ